MDIKITKELAEQIVNYLAQRPYVEVVKMIEALLQQANRKPDGQA